MIARELAGLLAREYLSTELVTRMERPEREHFRTVEEYEKAFRAWNRRMGKMHHTIQHTMQKHDPGHQPQREHYGSHEEYDKAFRKWNQQNRKIDHGTQKLVDQHAKQAQKDQQKASETKKVGIVGKVLGKLKPKGKKK